MGAAASRARGEGEGNTTTQEPRIGQGPSSPPRRERRRHRVYVTRNTEYHFRDGFCVAVRDRRSGDFLQGHLAIKRRLHGGLKFFPNGAIIPNSGDPRPGEALYFAAEGRDLVTSPLESIDRPEKAVVEAYPEPPPERPSATARQSAR